MFSRQNTEQRRKGRGSNQLGVWGTQQTWTDAWQQALHRELQPPDPQNGGICESLKNVYFCMPQMIKQLVIKYEFFFPE